MKHCRRCGVDVSGELRDCPLCQGPLEGAPSPAAFPHERLMRPRRLLVRLLTLCSGLAVLAMAMLAWTDVVAWNVSLLVCVLVVLNWLFARNVLDHEPGVVRAVSRYLLVLMVCFLAWYLLTGFPIMTNVLVPITTLAAVGFDLAGIVIWRGRWVRDYAKYLVFDIVCSLVPLLTLALGWVGWPLLAWLSAYAGAALMLSVLVFFWHDLKDELAKLFAA